MRILFVDHAGVLGGAELYLLDVARAFRDDASVILFEDGPFRTRLRESGVDVHLLAASGGLREVKRESRIGALLRAVPSVAGLVWRLARRAREYDVLFANSQKALIVSALAGWLAGRPVVWNLHDILTADHFSAVTRWLAVAVANRFADHVVVNSEATRRSFVESGGTVETSVVYNGIDAEPFDAVADADVRSLRAQLGVGEAPVVGVFSRLAPWKGQHVLLDALTRLPGVHAVLVGDALFGADDDYAAALHTQVREAGLGDRVHFAGFQDAVPLWMKAVDVVAHTSTAPEPFGRVIVEGMLAGRPVVATAAGGATEIVDDRRTGRLVPPGDAAALADALRDLFDAPERTAALADAGRDEAQTRFSRASMIDGVRRALDRVHRASPQTLGTVSAPVS